jgi:hypothetical protein
MDGLTVCSALSANRLPLGRDMRYAPCPIPLPFRGVRGMEVLT